MSPVNGGDRMARLRDALEREYRIERESRNGATAVYLAHDRALDRRVLIRAVEPALAGEAAAELAREARLLARLSHPSIPSVHHAGALEGCHIVVLEHAGSETLADRLRQAPLPTREALRLGSQLLGALEVVHAAGMAHSAIRADNVLIADGRFVLDGFAAARPAAGDGLLDDLSAVARLILQAGGPLPRRMRRVVDRALSRDPAQRWRTAAEFRNALEAAARRPSPRSRLSWLAGAGVLVLAAASGAWALLRAKPGPGRVPRELAILPFEVEAGPVVDPLGTNLAYLLQLNLEHLPGLSLTSRREVDRWWDAQGRDALSVDGPTAARRLRAHWVARGLIHRRPGNSVKVRVSLYDSLGAKSVLPEIGGSTDDLAALGDSVTLQLIRLLAPRADSLYEPVTGLATVPLGALKAFLQGEAAFAQDAWLRAERYYQNALDGDSTFALAEWRLANVKRWRRLPYELDLRSIAERHGPRLRRSDRALLEALLEPDLEVRFARLDFAVRRRPADAYARLLQGEELVHRGPLAGRGLESALPVMAAAIALDSSLALAYDHLVLAHIRFGHADSARRALDVRHRLSSAPHPGDMDLPAFLELAYDERFDRGQAWLRYRWLSWRRDPRLLEETRKLARIGTPWMDMPDTQLRYCDLLLRAARPTAETHATAHEGKGLAFFALGRPGRALAEIDSAAILFGSPEARLQQAEWRVIPPALGFPVPDSGDWTRELEALADDPVLGDRAAWALALGRLAAGDTVEALRWSDRIAAGAPLRSLLDAGQAAARGDLALALARSDSIRLAFQVTRPPDAFAGAVFHLWRGDWRAALGQRERADGEWLWYEASDVEGWPEGLAQAGEVDAALGGFARLKRARTLLSTGAAAGDTLRACDHLRRIAQLWADAEPPVRGLADEAATLARGCPR